VESNDPLWFLASSIKKQVVRMGLSPAWFPISSQRIGGEPELSEMGCINPSFFV